MENYVSSFQEYLRESANQNQPIMESSLSRVWQHIQSDKPFAMLSLSRGTMSSSEKRNAFNELKKRVRDLGYGFIEIKGGYVEKGADGAPDLEIADELSLMVPNMSKNDAITLGQVDLGHGEQDSILFSDGRGFLGYIVTNPSVGTVGSVDMQFKSGKDAMAMGREAVSQYFSMLAKGNQAGRKFAFVPESVNTEIQLWEMRDRRQPSQNFNGDWWTEFGMRIQ
jgi:hypothetical protein